VDVVGISFLQGIEQTVQVFIMQVALVFLSVVAFAAAASYDYQPSTYTAPHSAYPAQHAYQHKPTYKHDNYDYAPAYYNFDYAVKDDYTYVDMGHNEKRDGDKTNGQYNVVLPDGRRQIVNYYVDGYSGYVADVKYEGEAKYEHNYKPAYKASYEPTYKPAYKAAYKPAYTPSYTPAYKPAY